MIKMKRGEIGGALAHMGESELQRNLMGSYLKRVDKDRDQWQALLNTVERILLYGASYCLYLRASPFLTDLTKLTTVGCVWVI
jgi:hypothetical protein